jgi:hypothetical protein
VVAVTLHSNRRDSGLSGQRLPWDEPVASGAHDVAECILLPAGLLMNNGGDTPRILCSEASQRDE